MTELVDPVRPGSAKKRAGLVGAVLGVAAAGVAAGIATERALIRRTRRQPDPFAGERFGQQLYDEALTVTAPDGTDLYVEVVEPVDGVDLDLGLDSLDSGRIAEPALVFVHGFCLDMGSFFFQRAELTRRGEYRMVFYDQPGHGRSGRLKSGEYELPALGEALRAVIDEVVPEQPIVLIGHSLGGMVIMAFAELYPRMFGDRVVGVALVSSSAGRRDQAKLSVPAIVSKAGQPLLPLFNGATRITGGVIDRARMISSDLAWLLARRYGFGSPRPSPSLVSFVEQMISGTSTETIVRYLHTLYTHARYPALAALRSTPVLVICGNQDMITPLACSEEICRHLPDAELVVAPGGGHVTLLEHGDLVNRALAQFLARINPADGDERMADAG